MAINFTTSKQQIQANVAEDKVTATVSAGFGATGPSGVINVTAPITNAGTTTAANIGLSVGTGLAVSGGSLVLGSHTHDDRYYTETEVNTLLTGYATLVGGKVPSDQLPSYVDDVLEYANVASLPVTGETGKIYVALNTGKIYRWSGSAYFEISTPPDNTDAVPEGSTNLYFTNARARNAFGTGTTGQVITWSGGQWTAGSVTVAAGDITSGTLASARLPIASAGALGAVRIGSGISIDGSGIISASSGYTLPTATNSVLGGVKIGSGVTITDGVISVSTNYAAASHTHGISDVTGLQTALDGKQASGSYAAAVHTHGISDVTGLQTALDGKAATSHSHAISDVTGLQTALDGKQASGSYAAATHSHAIGDVTGLQTALDGKASLSHAHSVADVSAGSTAGLVIVTTTGGVLSALSQGTAGQVLKVNGTATGVEWGSASSEVTIDTTAADILSASTGSISADDPGADRLVFWDDSAGKLTHLTVGTGLTITDTTITSAGSTSASDLTSGTLGFQRLPSRVRASTNLYLWSSFR